MCIENRRKLVSVSDWNLALEFVGLGPSVLYDRSKLILFPVDYFVNLVRSFCVECCDNRRVGADGVLVELVSTCHADANGLEPCIGRTEFEDSAHRSQTMRILDQDWLLLVEL